MASSPISWVFGIFRHRIEPRSPGPLANTQLIRSMAHQTEVKKKTQSRKEYLRNTRELLEINLCSWNLIKGNCCYDRPFYGCGHTQYVRCICALLYNRLAPISSPLFNLFFTSSLLSTFPIALVAFISAYITQKAQGLEVLGEGKGAVILFYIF